MTKRFSPLARIPLTGNRAADAAILQIEKILYDAEDRRPSDVTRGPRRKSFSLYPLIRGEPDGWMDFEATVRDKIDGHLKKLPHHMGRAARNRLMEEIAKTLRHPALIG